MMLKSTNFRLPCLVLMLICGTDWSWASPNPGIKFIENKCQWPQAIDYSAKVPGGRMSIQSGKFLYYFIDEKKIEELHEQTHADRNESDAMNASEQMINGHRVEVTFVGANENSSPLPFGRSKEYYNYFIGDKSDAWASRAYGYDGFIYTSMYPNIDLKVYSLGQNVKYDFIVAANADPSQIVLSYQGFESLTLDNEVLTVKTSVADIIEQKPVAYQWIEGKKVFVKVSYSLIDNRLSFCFPEGYDPCYELTIDPLLIFSTYSGSTADNWGSTATPGEHGNLYSSGVTTHVNAGGQFPATAGAFQTTYGGLYDIAILKYDSTGQQLLYASYLGGDQSESPHSLVMNSAEELIVLGTTSSSDFPTTANALDQTFNGGTPVSHVVSFVAGSDIVLARISKDGTQLLGSTFLGGEQNDGQNPPLGVLTKNYGDELRGDVITDSENSIYVSSVTASTDFPAVNGRDLTYNGGGTDAILVKLKPDLSEILWSTFIGGDGMDASHTLKLNSNNEIILAGGTTSSNFPVKADAYQPTLKGDADGWIAHVGSAGDSIHYATYTGTSTFDQIYFVDINESEEVYVYGQTDGDFPVTPGVYSNPNSGQFVQKFNNAFTSLIFSTVFGSGGGIPDISPTAFLVNECNNLYMSGWGGIVNSQTQHWQSNTRNMPITGDAFQSTTSGSDFYFMVLTDDASQFLYGTYLGGRSSTTHVDGGTSRFDKGGVVYHAVCAGCAAYNTAGSSTSDFPSTANAWSRVNRSGNCNNAAFKFDLSSLKARLQSNSVRLDMPGLNKVCIPDTIVFQNFSTGGEIFEWDLGDGTRIVKTDTSNVPHRYLATGRYTVSLKAIDPGTCKVKDSTSIKVDIFIAQGTVQDDDALCFGSSYQLKASGAVQYSWVSEDGTFQSQLATPIVSPTDTTRYFITLNEASGCVRKDTVELSVISLINPEFEMEISEECLDRPKITVTNLTDSLREGDRVYFDYGDGRTSDALEDIHEFEKDGVYEVKIVGVREFCVTEKVISTPAYKLLIPNIITPQISDNANDVFTIQLGDEKGLTPAHFGYKTAVSIYNRWGRKVFESDDYQYDWDGDGLATGIYYYEVSIDGNSVCKSWIHLVK